MINVYKPSIFFFFFFPQMSQLYANYNFDLNAKSILQIMLKVWN